jgi:hypothetical protein
MTARRTTLSAANGGWVRVTIDDDAPFEVRVRPNERGRLEVVELRLAPGGPIDSTTLRQVQLAHVEVLVNAANLHEHIVARLEVPGPVMFDRTDAVVQPETVTARGEAFDATVRVTEHASGGAHGQQRVSGTTTGHKVVEAEAKIGAKVELAGDAAVAAAAEGALTVELTDSASVADSLTVTVKQWSAAMLRRSALFNAPPGPKPDGFYEKVAIAYERLSVRSNRPAAEIAEAVGVPLTTAHRWVKRARQLGYLPPGQKGRRG